MVKMRDKKDNKWGSWELPCHRVLTGGPNFSYRVARDKKWMSAWAPYTCGLHVFYITLNYAHHRFMSLHFSSSNRSTGVRFHLNS